MKKITLNTCCLCGSDRIKKIDSIVNFDKCCDCGYIFVNPRPSKQDIAHYYSKCENFDNWLIQENDFDRLSQRRLKIVRRFKHGGSLLDVGAGVGQFLNSAKKYFKISGTEVSKNAIKIAKDKYSINLLKGEVEKWDTQNKKYDVITIFHVLEHVHDPGLLIDKCRSMLKKNGVIIIAVPNDVNKFFKLPVKRILRILKIGRFKNYGPFGMEKINLDKKSGEIHLSQFTDKVLVRYFRDNRFKILLNSVDPYYVPDSFKNRLKFLFFKLIKNIFCVNWYDTIMFVVKNR